MAVTPQILRFDTGIERIVQDTRPTDVTLPERRQGSPAIERPRARLEELLGAGTLERVLQSYLQPEIHHPDIMNPGTYDDAINTAGEQLQEMLAQSEDEDFQALGELLAEDQNLRLLLNTYRNMLVQG